MDSRRIENHFTLEAETAKINSNATAFADPVVFQQAILCGVKIISSLQYFTSVICLFVFNVADSCVKNPSDKSGISCIKSQILFVFIS